MKRFFGLFFTVILLLGLFTGLPVAADGSLSASASATTVTIGSTVTVTLKYSSPSDIGAIDAHIAYNDAAFDYVSYQDAANSGGVGTAVGGGGVVTVSWYATGATAPTSTGFSITFKAKAAGNGNFSISTPGFTNDSDVSLGNPSKKLSVSCINPTKSGNADLAYLKPSAGTLVPAFSPDVTAYTVTVPYTVTSLLLTTDSKDQNAQVAVNGSSTMKVGKNVRSVTVTAPNGTTKTYTVTITRSEDQSTGSSDGGSTTTTTVAPAEDPLEVSVDGELMTVADTQPTIELPAGFTWEPMELSGVMVPAAKNADSGLTLLYLTSVTDEKSAALYIYGEDGLFTPFRPLTVQQSLYTLLPLPEALEVPAGAVAGEVTVGDTTVDAYVYEDTALKDISLVYAVGPTGHTGLYVYDTTDGSMQQYRELSAPTQPEPVEEEQPTNTFVKFVTDYRNVILICAAACGGLALLIGAVVLVLILSRQNSKARH